MGFVGVIWFRNICIGDLSGTFNECDYYSWNYERAYYNNNDIRSIYNVCEYDVHKMM